MRMAQSCSALRLRRGGSSREGRDEDVVIDLCVLGRKYELNLSFEQRELAKGDVERSG